MISSRWPRPMAVMASMATIPVCSGSFTGCRCTTDGAWISRTRYSSYWIGPFPSTGLPTGSMTRPRTPSPTPAERMRPVCLTGCPSSMVSASPSTMQPIDASSRLKAMPRMPPGNSSSSFAMAPGRPCTMATPSPVAVTRPTCSRSRAGSKPSTYLRSAAAMSCGEIVRSCAILGASPLTSSSGLHELFPGHLELPPDRPVEHLVSHPGHHAADHAGIDQDAELDLLPSDFMERLGQPPPLILVERNGGPHLRHRLPVPFRGHLHQRVDDAGKVLRPALVHQEPKEAYGVAVGLGPQQLLEDRLLPFGRKLRVGQGLAEVALSLDRLGELVQLGLDLVEAPLGLGHGEQRPGVALDQPVGLRHAGLLLRLP